MGRLVVIEGLDGAGKRTLADGLATALTAAKVARLGFPRYGVDVHADLVRDALYGRSGDLPDSVHGMAVLFALDRRDASDRLRELRRENDVVLLDRYVASNAAYGAARLHQAADRYENDAGLQARCAVVYDGLAAGGWLAPWSVLDDAADASTASFSRNGPPR